jgi:hypothetical protein
MHTAGPWNVNAGKDRILDDRGRSLLRLDQSHSLFEIPIVELEANLRVGAAAPELLGAVRDWIDYCDKLEKRGPDADLNSAVYMESLRKRARAILAKVQR